MGKSWVIVESAPEYDYLKDFVVLPKCFGTSEYDEREDVKNIRATVDRALDKLDARVDFSSRLAGYRHIIIKPNLVSVYHDSGFDEKDYPETTDPRVFEAVVRYIRRYNPNIIIAESSGKPMPTTASFKVAGYDRIAKFYNTGLVALEHRPVVRYMLPKAEVMKEVYLPDTLDEAVRGEAFYISVPKMKTNLYTGVTLGFKNAMGTIPYFLRERNHSYLINKKLADLLYLFKPDLTVIDGIIGGEGNTPAPVDPVRVGRIVVSDNSVEADRITTAMMGFDPDKNKLMIEAARRGFGNPDTEVMGDTSVVRFRPAISSFMDEKTARDFPGILALTGQVRDGVADGIIKRLSGTDKPVSTVSPKEAFELESACTGGCLAAAKTGLEYYNYSKHSSHGFELCIVMGPGVEIDGTKYWFDKTGKAYTVSDIAKLRMNRLALGGCTCRNEELSAVCTHHVYGCCDPAECMSVTSHAAGVTMPIATPRNKGLISTFTGMLKTVNVRRGLIKKGMYVDCPHSMEDRIFEIPAGHEEEDYVLWPLAPMSAEERKKQLKDQWKIVKSTLGM